MGKNDIISIDKVEYQKWLQTLCDEIDRQRLKAVMQLNAFDLLALYRVSRGESIRNVDSVTLKKLLSQELLIETSDGIKLTPLYDEMKLRAGVTDKTEDKNVQVNIPNLAALFNVSEKTIRRDLYVLCDLNLIQYVGSNKMGHWEAVNQ